jgi:hypothetical protein
VRYQSGDFHSKNRRSFLLLKFFPISIRAAMCRNVARDPASPVILPVRERELAGEVI